MSDMIQFNGDIVRSIIDAREPGRRVRRVYAVPRLNYSDPQHIANRIMNRIIAITTNGCWRWGGAVINGYASMGIEGHMRGTHRVAWAISRGKSVPENMFVCHKCDNPLCVNPEHLFLGTHGDNMRDMVKKGRHGPPPPPKSGSENSNSKLTESDVSDIRLRLNRGEAQSSIAGSYSMSQSQVSRIKNGLMWKSEPWG